MASGELREKITRQQRKARTKEREAIIQWMKVNSKKGSASNKLSTAKSKQCRAYNVQQTASDKNKQGTATGEGSNDMQRATTIWEQLL